MNSDDKSRMPTLRIDPPSKPKAVRELPPITGEPFRSLEELDPVARQISLDRNLMQKFREVMGRA